MATQTLMGAALRCRYAVTRALPKCFAAQSLRQHEPSMAIDQELAVKQHERYNQTLQNLGLNVTHLPADEKLADCCFVEDTAVIAFDRALITTPGHPNRVPETKDMEKHLRTIKGLNITRMEDLNPKARCDGGDVLFTGKHFFVGLSTRTDETGVEVIRNHWKDAVTTHAIPVSEGLHLKSFLSMVAPNIIAIHDSAAGAVARKSIEAVAGDQYSFITLKDAFAANMLYINGTVVHRSAQEFPNSIPHLVAELDKHKLNHVELNMSEMMKADGALTCCSILF